MEKSKNPVKHEFSKTQNKKYVHDDYDDFDSVYICYCLVFFYERVSSMNTNRCIKSEHFQSTRGPRTLLRLRGF